MTVMTSREFSDDVGKAKNAALKGPVIITERGRETYVLMTMEEFRKRQNDDGEATQQPSEAASRPKSIVELLSYPAVADIELELPERRISADWRIPDLSDEI